NVGIEGSVSSSPASGAAGISDSATVSDGAGSVSPLRKNHQPPTRRSSATTKAPTIAPIFIFFLFPSPIRLCRNGTERHHQPSLSRSLQLRHQCETSRVRQRSEKRDSPPPCSSQVFAFIAV